MPAVTFYEFNAAGKRVHASKVALKGGAFGFYHDFLVTENFYVLYENPVNLDLKTFATEYMLSKCGIAQCLKVRTVCECVNSSGNSLPDPSAREGVDIRTREGLDHQHASFEDL